MGVINLNLIDEYRQRFGSAPRDFDFDEATPRKDTADLGSRYFAKDAQGRDYKMPVKLGDYDLPYPVVSIRGFNQIVETKLTDVRGTQKEFITASDYLIRIRGFIVHESNQYPEAEVKKLKELINKREALEIRSVITDIFMVTPDRQGYDKAVIYDWDLPDAEGVDNVHDYELILKSDAPFDAYID